MRARYYNPNTGRLISKNTIKDDSKMKAYSHRLKPELIFQNRSSKRNCHNNLIIKNFFGLLKQEIYYGVVYYSYEELKSEIERYIKYYNEQLIKEKLGLLSPLQYRLNLFAA